MKIVKRTVLAVAITTSALIPPSSVQGIDHEQNGEELSHTYNPANLYDRLTLTLSNSFFEGYTLTNAELGEVAATISPMKGNTADLFLLLRPNMTKDQRFQLIRAIGNPMNWFPEDIPPARFFMDDEESSLGDAEPESMVKEEIEGWLSDGETERNTRRLEKIQALIPEILMAAHKATSHLKDPQVVLCAAIPHLRNRDLLIENEDE